MTSEQCAARQAEHENIQRELIGALAELLKEAEAFAKAIPPYAASQAIANARAVLAKIGETKIQA